MHRHNQHAYDRGGRSRKSGSGHSHPQRIDEDIIQNDICEASDDHSGHGKTRRTIIPHETEQQIISQKQRGKHQQDTDVVSCITDRICIRTENRGNLVRKQYPGRGKDHSSEHNEIQCMSKDRAVQCALRFG